MRFVQWVYPKIERTIPSLAYRFFITIFFTPLNYKVPEKEKSLERDAEKFTVKAAGKTIQCYAWGRGPLILLVHGWAGRATQFRKIIQALVAANFRVVGFDGPAHGRSGGMSTNILEFEETLKAMYDSVGEPEGVIAHSFGGGAVLYAAMNGLVVKKLINIAVPTVADEIIDTYLKTINGSKATAKYFKSYILETNGKPFEEFTALYFIRHLKQHISLLLIHDEGDKDVAIHQAEEVIKIYPKARLVKTKGLGHTRILKDDAVCKKCVSFMKDSVHG